MCKLQHMGPAVNLKQFGVCPRNGREIYGQWRAIMRVELKRLEGERGRCSDATLSIKTHARTRTFSKLGVGALARARAHRAACRRKG